MITTVNDMFGFPEEGVSELENTRRFMEQLAPAADYSNNRLTLHRALPNVSAGWLRLSVDCRFRAAPALTDLSTTALECGE